MSGELVISDEELEKMIANVEWNSDEDCDVEEPYDSLSVSINAKVLYRMLYYDNILLQYFSFYGQTN